MKNLLSLLVAISLVVYTEAKEITADRAQEIATEFLRNEQTNPPNIVVVAQRKSAIQKNIGGLTLGEIQPIVDDSNTLLAYIQKLEPEGFIIVSADDIMRPILGFSFKGKYKTGKSVAAKVLIDLITADVNARKLNPSQEKNEITHSTSSSQWGPWLQSVWRQGAPWNNQCPYDDPNAPGDRRLVGCVATAAAQIVNYWQYPNSMTFSSDDNYPSGSIDIFGDVGSYGFPTASELTTNLQNITYNGDADEEAYISFGIGVKLEMHYGPFISGTYTSSVARVLREDFGFGSAIAPPSRSGMWAFYSAELIEDLKNARPIQIGISKSGESGGHSVVVDGYRDDGEFFHLNYGWGSDSPNPIDAAWYNIPTSLPKYDVVHTIVYRISKFQGWNQFGADERKTFRTRYSAPTDSDIKEKWHVTTAADYSFKGLIVGKGNMIVASNTPNNQNQGDPPSVWFIDQYGSKLGEVVFVDEDESLTMPVQSIDGAIYVGTSEGGVYQIDIETRSANKIFQEPSNEEFSDPPTIDKNGNIYFSTFYTLYSFSPSGMERWHFTSPNSGFILRGAPAIDSDRGIVYISHYDPATKIPYLRAINITTGAMVSEKAFPAVAFSSRAAGIATLDSDGTIYVGSDATLYALNPDATLSEKWSRDFSPFLMSEKAPVIGKNGRIYVVHWGGSESAWTLNISALDKENSSTIWSLSYPNPDGFDNIFQPYMASNDVIVFPFHFENGSDPDTYEVHAYKDNGANATLLWKKSFNSDGGKLAFGPGATVYVIPSSGFGHTITAISDGDVGDPEGGGESYINNRPPTEITNPSPAIGATDQDTASVQLSWSSSDPDGHTLKYSIYVSALVEGEEAGFVPVATQIEQNTYTLTNLRFATEYLWSVVATDGQAISEGSIWDFSTVGYNISVDEELIIAESFELSQNYPNPFNPVTMIGYSLPRAGDVTLIIYNLLGEEIARLIDGHQPLGTYQSTWDASNFASGIYFYRLQAGEFVQTRKMVLLK